METIFAPATAAGRSGVAVLRISGDRAASVFALLGLPCPAPRLATLATLKHPATGEVIDQALLLWFPAPASFTGEDVVECHLHGSRAVMREMVALLSAQEGFRLAEPGEFSRRAFMNEKMDLTEAEAVADLIHAETHAQKQQALRQMSGALSEACSDLRASIIAVRAHLEAYLDFPDEDIPDAVAAALDTEILNIEQRLAQMLGDNRVGEKIREGLYGVILGVPNAGKSTLINALAQRDVAIVSEEAGTTRDVLEVHLDVGGVSLTLADTAGLRETTSAIEIEGIRRATERAAQADLRLLVLDVSLPRAAQTAILALKQPHDVVILNKTELHTPYLEEYRNLTEALHLSAKHAQGLEHLISVLKHRIDERLSGAQHALITRQRHRTACKKALQYLDAARNTTLLELKGEELRLASLELGKILGVIGVEDILDVVFSSFCIGK